MRPFKTQKAEDSNESSAFILSGWGDLNSRPLAPQTSTLTGLSYIPKCGLQYYKESFNSNKKAFSFRRVS